MDKISFEEYVVQWKLLMIFPETDPNLNNNIGLSYAEYISNPIWNNISTEQFILNWYNEYVVPRDNYWLKYNKDKYEKFKTWCINNKGKSYEVEKEQILYIGKIQSLLESDKIKVNINGIKSFSVL